MSKAERQKRYRDKKRNALSVTRVTVDDDRNAHKMLEHQDSAQINGDRNAHIECVPVGDGVMVQVGLDDYRTNPARYASRAHPELLNWGKWMNSQQLEQAGLKANRVSIPGDWDYVGVTGAAMVVIRTDETATGPAPVHEQGKVKARGG